MTQDELRFRLAHVISNLDFTNIPFADVISFLKEVSGASIVVQWGELGASGFDKTTPVDVHLSDVSVEQALRAVLVYMSIPGAELTHVLEDGFVRITTKDDADRSVSAPIQRPDRRTGLWFTILLIFFGSSAVFGLLLCVFRVTTSITTLEFLRWKFQTGSTGLAIFAVSSVFALVLYLFGRTRRERRSADA